jgi:hypothetical protein
MDFYDPSTWLRLATAFAVIVTVSWVVGDVVDILLQTLVNAVRNTLRAGQQDQAPAPKRREPPKSVTALWQNANVAQPRLQLEILSNSQTDAKSLHHGRHGR